MSALTVLRDVDYFQWILLTILLIPVLTYASFFRKRGSLVGAPPLDRENIPGLGPLRFFTDRMNYMKDAAERSKSGNFSFWVGPYPAIGLSGPSGRAAYWNAVKDMNLAEGMNKLIIGAAAPPQDDQDPNVIAKKGWNLYGKARLLDSIRPEKLQAKLPAFYKNCTDTFSTLGDSGSFNPMVEIYQVAWKMTMQALGPAEIYENPEVMDKTFWWAINMDSLLHPLDALMPWLLTPKKIKKMICGLRLFMLLQSTVKARRNAVAAGEARKDDTLQMMLDYGDSDTNIATHMVEKLFTAQINTGMNAAYTLCYLGASPKWQQRVHQEVVEIAAKYAKNKTAPLLEQIGDIPQEAWESDFPVIYACLKDSVRLNTTGLLCRINKSNNPVPLHPVGKDGVTTGSREVIPPGAIITYRLNDSKADPVLYPDPDVWSPGRYLPEEEEYSRQGYRDVAFGDITWGSGKHMCTGMRLAKVEAHMITAIFVAKYEWELTDKKGAVLKEVPPNWNVWLPMREEGSYMLRYRKRSSE